MTDWLVYWKTYWEDVEDPRDVDAHWHSSYEQLYQEAKPGDVIWVVVSGGVGNEAEWRLLERFSLRQKKTIDENVKGYKYRFEGDSDSHDVFDPSETNDLTQILLGLEFASSHPISYRGRQIGQALQHARELAPSDVEALRQFAASLRPIKEAESVQRNPTASSGRGIGAASPIPISTLKTPMALNDLLRSEGIDPQNVLVLRHSPQEPELAKVLPWLAAERHDVFNAYQQTQGEKVQNIMQKMIGPGYVASFIARKSHQSLFVGLYAITGAKPLTEEEYWQMPANRELKSYTHQTASAGNWPPVLLWFDLLLTDFCMAWKGRLIVDWPPGRLWYRRAHTSPMPVSAILEDSALDKDLPEWREIDLSWDELCILPKAWKAALRHWRCIYYIYDVSDGKGYVGSASGGGNLLDRWENYAATGHGGNRLLREREARNLRFSILERVSPDMARDEVVQLEQTWKLRLHTHAPQGLNEN